MADKNLADDAVISGITSTDTDEATLKDDDKIVEIDGEASEEDSEGDDEVTVSIGDASPASEENEATAPEWVKNLRKQTKEQAKEIRELKDKLTQVLPQQNVVVELGAKPTLEGCEYDADKFENELTAYFDRKRKSDEQKAARDQENENSQKAWQKTLSTYEEKKTNLKVKDFAEAEDVVKQHFSQIQQTAILLGANDPSLIVYALGKNTTELTRLAKITDLVKFSFEVARLEGKLKVSTKKAPPPEKTIRSGGTPLSGGNAEKTLASLRAEAEKTNDYSKVVRFKNQLKERSS